MKKHIPVRVLKCTLLATLGGYFCLFLTACQLQIPLGQRLLVQGVGVDWSEEEGYTATLQVNEVQQDSGNGIAVYTAKGETVLEAVRNVSSQNGKIPLYFHDLTVVLGEEAAKYGLSQMLDYFLRNADIPSASILLVARGTAQEMLSAKKEDRILPASQLGDAVGAGSYNGRTAAVDITALLNHISGEGSSAYLPLVQMEGDTPVASGTVLLNGKGKMVDTLSVEETRGLLLLTNRQQDGYFSVEAGDAEAALEIGECNSEITVIEQDQTVLFQVTISCGLNIGALDGSLEKKYDESYYEKIEKAAEEKLKKDAQSAIETCVFKNQADVFQFGRWLHKENPEIWKQWQDIWPEKMTQCIYDVQIQAEVQRVGKEISPSIE